MTESRVQAPTDHQQDLVAAWRTESLDIMPYMAALLFSLRLVNAPGLGTFAVDAQHRLYIDFDFVEADPATWTNRMCAEVLLHETGHLFGGHAARADEGGIKTDQREMWNYSADLEINDDLHQAGCTQMTAYGLLPSKVGMADNLLAEQYFAQLLDRAAKKPKPQNGQGQPQQGQGQAGQDQQSPQSGDQQGKGKPYKGCGSGSGSAPAPDELGDDAGQGGFAEPITEAGKRRIEIATAVAISEHASRSRGSVPGGMLRRAEQLLEPAKIPWRQVLASSIRRAVAKKMGDYDTDSSRRSRRRHDARLPDGRGIIYPGIYTPVPSLAVVRDTSGSMGRAELEAVTNEVDGISRQAGVRGKDLRVLDVDAGVSEVRDYRDHTTLADITGGGGTDMRVGIEAAVALTPRPTAVIVVTDGYTPWPTDPTRVPLIICLVGGGAQQAVEIAPQWATVVIVDED
ncbi:MAG: VWA-like domain-containing protein [Nakamurella sp.]